jgi:dTDP-glucose 4,6-dehydratase
VSETYNIGGRAERRNIDVVSAICAAMDALVASPRGGSHEKLIELVPDRPGHDFRYAIDFGKLKAELGWSPRHSFEQGLAATVRWYVDNRAWWEPLLAKHQADIRRGLAPQRV